MRSLTFTQCRDVGMGVIWEDLGALTTERARQFRMEAIYLRLRKIVLERVTVVKFREWTIKAAMVLAVFESR